MFYTCSFKSAACWLGRCASSSRLWPRSHINPVDNLHGRWQHFALCFLCGLLVMVKPERSSKDNEQHCHCVVWEGKTVLQSLDVDFSTPSRKSSFLHFFSFLRRRMSTSFASSRRFSRWQTENQGDSRLGQVRIIIFVRTCALLNAQQIKFGES